jgi:hypothetical protein
MIGGYGVLQATDNHFCPGCGVVWDAGARFCNACGSGADGPAPPPVVLPEQRRRVLQERVNHYVDQQYRVISQTETAAQLVKPKRFSVVWFLLWCLLALVGGLVYIIYHAFMKRERQVYLQVDEHGRVRETRDKR